MSRELGDEANVYNLDTSFDYEDMFDKGNELPPDPKLCEELPPDPNMCEEEFYYSNFASSSLHAEHTPKEETPLDYSGYMVTNANIAGQIQEEYVNEKVPSSQNVQLDKKQFTVKGNSEFARRMKSKVSFTLPDEFDETDDESDDDHCYDSPPPE